MIGEIRCGSSVRGARVVVISIALVRRIAAEVRMTLYHPLMILYTDTILLDDHGLGLIQSDAAGVINGTSGCIL